MLQSRSMLRLAGGVLLIGAVSLLIAGGRLYGRALAAGLPQWHLVWISALAVLGGIGKARFVMRRRMRENARRLAEAAGPMWPWQVYPPQLLAFIASMVLTMFIMKRVFADNALALGLLGGLDLGVAVALVVASLDYRGVASGVDDRHGVNGSA